MLTSILTNAAANASNVSLSGGAIAGIVIGCIIGGIIIGALLGFFISQKYMKKQQEENPPITRETVKAMYAQMGRTPSEQQINQMMGLMKKQQQGK